MRTVALGIAFTVVVLAACSSSDTLDVPSSTDLAATTPTSTTEPSATPTATVPLGPPLIEGIDFPVITLLSAATGVGERPLLEWSAVEGVARYDVVVFDPDGNTYWAWSTSDTSVFLGGAETTNPDASGPMIRPGMTWAVLGIDATGLPVAQSTLRPIAP